MATVTTLARGGTSGTAAGSQTLGVQQAYVNIADAVAAGLATTDYTVALNIPADSLLTVWGVTNITSLSLGSGPRIDVGDSAAATTFVNNATSVTINDSAAIALLTKVYNAADTLRVKVTGGTVASGIIRITYSLVDLGTALPPAKSSVTTIA